MAWGLFVLWFIITALTIWGNFLAQKKLASSPPHLDAPFNLYPVTILKPLKGADAALEKNIESFFELDYPNYEILISVPSFNDPAYSIAARTIARNPRIKARLFAGEAKIGPNPKINNILKAYESALNDWILISDSNVRVERNYLKRLVAHLEPGVGLVTAIVAGREAHGLGGRLESTYLNTFYARGMSLIERLGHPCVVGKSMLFQRSTATRFGGIQNLARYLAEDYMAGEAMLRLGLRVVVATDPVPQIIGQYSFKEFWSRHIRWGRIRKAQAPLAFLFEPLTGCFLSACLGAWASSQLFNITPWFILVFHFSVWSLGDLLLMLRLGERAHVLMPAWWFLRELLAFPLWIHIASGNTVNWRGTHLTIQQGGMLAEN